MNPPSSATTASPTTPVPLGAQRSTLVVYFSRRGHTRQLALLIAEQCGADTEEIVDGVHRRGPLGYVRSLVEALLRLPTPIQPSQHAPRDYDTVVVGTPVWAWQMASPVRAYLKRHRGRFRRVALFCCHRGWGAGPVLGDMARLCARPAAATLVLSNRELAGSRYRAPLTRFVRAVRALRSPRPTAGWRRAA